MPQELQREVWGFDGFRPGQGEIVEAGAADDILLRPRQAYTRDLLASMPRMAET